MQLPTGTVRFLFTDIEGSTRLLQQLGENYRAVQDDHAQIMRRTIDEGGGVAVGSEGDSFFAVFADHRAAAAQRLGDDGFRRLWAEGKAMSLQDALAYGRQNS